jgi:hypothetical protein
VSLIKFLEREFDNKWIIIKAEKITIYKDLIRKIQRIWTVKAKVIPVITGRLEPFHSHSEKYLSNRPGNNEIKELKNTEALHTYYGQCLCKRTKHISRTQ